MKVFLDENETFAIVWPITVFAEQYRLSPTLRQLVRTFTRLPCYNPC